VFLSLVVGIHLASAHLPSEPWHENFNPGMFVASENYVGGAFRNSLGRLSIYGARTFTWDQFSLSLGLISGYKKKYWEGQCLNGNQSTDGHPCFLGSTKYDVGPMFAPSYKFGDFRLTFIPGFGTASALHLSVELPTP
jgi:hypothetical protein